MGHDKLRKFAENETFACLLQPSSRELLADGYARLRDHDIKGHWRERMFAGSAATDDGGIVLELGCGKGEYTIELAQRNPARNYVGVDIKGARLWKGAKYATQHALPNVAFLRTRVEFISAFFAPGEVSEIWLTFSDPQFRSENSRLSSPVFLERYRRFLKPGGVVHLKTDSRFLHEYTKAVCKVNGLELLACTADLYGTGKPDVLPAAGAGEADPRAVSSDFFVESADCSDVPADLKSAATAVQTFYESIFLEQGYPITYMAFRIDHDGPFAAPRDPEVFDSDYWRSVEGPRMLFGRDTAETRRQKLKK